MHNLMSCLQVVNRLHKDYVYETLLNYGVQYDHTWIYDKIHHEINQFCSAHSLQQVYIDMFDQVTRGSKFEKILLNLMSSSLLVWDPSMSLVNVRIIYCWRIFAH